MKWRPFRIFLHYGAALVMRLMSSEPDEHGKGEWRCSTLESLLAPVHGPLCVWR
jgi:hypothetical protein